MPLPPDPINLNSVIFIVDKMNLLIALYATECLLFCAEPHSIVFRAVDFLILSQKRHFRTILLYRVQRIPYSR